MLAALRLGVLALAAFQAAASAQTPQPTSPPSSAQTPASDSPTVDEIIARNLAARGGIAKLKSLQTLKLTGTITAQGMSVPMTTWAKRPGRMRQEMRFQDKKVVSAFDGTTAWVMDERRGGLPQDLPANALALAREDADFDPLLLDWQSKGHKVTLAGTEKIDGKPAYDLEVVTKAGKRQHYFIDAATGLERRTTMMMEQEGLKARVSIDFSDYRDVQGITMPFSMRQSLNGTVMRQVTIDSVTFNQPIDDAVFTKPVKP
jgi:outer membrane lipoprotein-sorting protein